MKTLSCLDLTKTCVDMLTADDSIEIQKVYLAHVHSKHQQQWSSYSKQFRAVSVVTMRNRFQAQKA